MKTAREIVDRAMQLCGYTNADGVPDRLRDADIFKKALPIVNQIYVDMFFVERPDEEFTPLVSMDEAIPLSVRCVNDIMPYGVAMLLAQAEGDFTTQGIFSYAYNQKRGGGVRVAHTIRDVLPTGEW